MKTVKDVYMIDIPDLSTPMSLMSSLNSRILLDPHPSAQPENITQDAKDLRDASALTIRTFLSYLPLKSALLYLTTLTGVMTPVLENLDPLIAKVVPSAAEWLEVEWLDVTETK
jgi:hypothetical protein